VDGEKLLYWMLFVELKTNKNQFQEGLCPRPQWGAYTVPKGTLAGGQGLDTPPQ